MPWSTVGGRAEKAVRSSCRLGDPAPSPLAARSPKPPPANAHLSQPETAIIPVLKRNPSTQSCSPARCPRAPRAPRPSRCRLSPSLRRVVSCRLCPRDTRAHSDAPVPLTFGSPSARRDRGRAVSRCAHLVPSTAPSRAPIAGALPRDSWIGRHQALHRIRVEARPRPSWALDGHPSLGLPSARIETRGAPTRGLAPRRLRRPARFCRALMAGEIFWRRCRQPSRPPRRRLLPRNKK